MVEGVVLAAGRGRRFHGVKPLMRVEGETALARTVRVLHEAGVLRVLVVVGHAGNEVADEARRVGAVVVDNPAYRRGLSTSLAAGIREVSAAAQGFVVVPADMPYLGTKTVHSVLEAARGGASIARPVLEGTPGFPVYFRATHRQSLCAALRGDRGARDYIRDHAAELVTLKPDDAGCISDVDAPTDLPHKDGERGLAVQTP